MKSAIVGTSLLAALAAAAPLEKRQSTDIDETILNYALTLEHLEAAFYKEGIAKFKQADFKNAGFTDANFYKNLKKIAADEASHVAVIQQVQKAAGYSSTEACEYNFGVTDAKSFVATAAILEGVGVTAYLGAASKITNKDYLTAAGSILTTEARHHAFLRRVRGQSPFAAAYDTPLDFSQVYSLAVPFIKSCPDTNPTLPVTDFPNLTATMKGKTKGDTITFKYQATAQIPDTDVFVAWPTVLGSIFQAATVDKDAKTVTSTVPQGAEAGPAGQAYAILVNSGTTLSDETTIAGPALVNVAVPYLAKASTA